MAQDHLEQFIKDSPKGEFKVTGGFHYGQAKKTGEGRFLVLHGPRLRIIHQVCLSCRELGLMPTYICPATNV